MELDLADIRRQLDGIDDQLIALFTQRMNLSAQVAEYKRKTGMPILDANREQQIIDRLSQKAGEFGDYTKALYQAIFQASRDYQARKLQGDQGE